MKKLNITIITTLSVEERPAIKTEVKSEAAMWNYLRQVRDGITDEDLKVGIQALVYTEDGTEFKNIMFRRNSKGKIEMPNSIKETCRRQVEKARKAAKEKAEKEAARRARKAEANRRYRARKKAEKEALKASANKSVETYRGNGESLINLPGKA